MRTLILILSCLSLALPSLATMPPRPTYPWASNQPYALNNGNARHHMIPWQELVAFGTQHFANNPNDLAGFIQNFNNIGNANLGEHNQNDLAQAYNNGDATAVETVEALLAWMQGNLVVGPANQPNDPGNVFDQVAFNCRQAHFPNAAYNNLQATWAGNNDQKWAVLQLLSTTAMTAQTTDGNIPNNCQW